MVKHKAQRVAVFVDVQNLYYSAKHLYKAKVNFTSLLKAAVSGRELVRALAYTIKADVKDEKNFHEALEKIGFEVRTKDLQIFIGGSKKGDWDVGIATDIIRMSPKVDVCVLISGDGDFAEAVNYAQAMGCRVEVLSFRKTTSAHLIQEADEFISIDGKKFML